MTALPRPLVALGFRRLGPWITRFEVNGRVYGGDVDFSSDARLTRFRAAFPGVRRVLELGALEGGHTVVLARTADRVVAVEARAGNVARARFAARALGLRNVEVVRADVEVDGPGAFGAFDAVFCSGLLYHLGRPMSVVDRLRDAAPNAFIWTHVARAATTTHGIDGTPGEWHDEAWLDDPSVGVNPRSFWPTLDALVAHLRAHGFPHVEVDEDPDHPGGPAATIVARA